MKTVYANLYTHIVFVHPDETSARNEGFNKGGPLPVGFSVPDDFKASESGVCYGRREFEANKFAQVVPVLEVTIEKASDAVTVGALNSSARGTGARKSAGKPDWSQIPWWTVPLIFRAWKDHKVREMSAGTYRVIELMADWQRGKNEALDLAAALLLEIIYAPGGRNLNGKQGDWFPIRGLESTVRVLEFGAKKYAKGNWAKGMSWSVCFTCTMSHLSKSFQGEEHDEESGINHLAHAMCNMLFLLGYRDLYPEGDDRLPEFRPAGVRVDLSHD